MHLRQSWGFSPIEGRGGSTKQKWGGSLLFTVLRHGSLHLHPLEFRMLVCRFLACLPFSLPYAILPHSVQNTSGNLSLSVSSVSQPLPWNLCKSYNQAASILIFGFMQQNGLYRPKLPMSIILVFGYFQYFSLFRVNVSWIQTIQFF